MSLESKSQELKELVSVFDTQWFLGYLSFLMQSITSGIANEELGLLSSPMRQLYYLGGLLMTSDDKNAAEIQCSPESWNKIVVLLNEVESEYDKLFFPQPDEEITDEWKRIRLVAAPSFLSYFNQGPLNYEEQTINWVSDLFSQLDDLIESKTGLRTENFVQFYNNLDDLIQRNFRGFTSQKKDQLRPNWEKYTKFELINPDVPFFMQNMFEERKPLMTFVSDNGIYKRFYPEEIVSENLNIDQVITVLNLLKCRRIEKDYIYYTETNPGNPLYKKPIVDIGENMYQVFEIKQVIHAIESYLESICTTSEKEISKYTHKKGKLLEYNIINLFKKYFGKDCKVFEGYFVDGNEQDILILWKQYAFIIEAKGYNLREPLRDPNRAFTRIKDDFNDSIKYAYEQALRVTRKFTDKLPLKIETSDGELIEEIDTSLYEENEFPIVVNLKSFGQIQNDLSTLLEVEEEDAYPWVVKYDDLEVFILTLIAQNKPKEVFVEYLLVRENLHGKLICSDELEVCAGFLKNKITERKIEKAEIIMTSPDIAELFDKQYNKGMGFRNEKLWEEKKSGKYIIL